MDLALKGKRALVTGASRGIGRAIAATLAGEGVDLAICARGRQGLEETATSLRALGTRVVATAVDVREPGALGGWVSKAGAELGGVDILVSNVSTRVDPASPNWWRETFEADLQQHVAAFDATLPLLLASGAGSVVFISSVAAVLTQLPPYEIAYGAMKAALTSFAGRMATVHGPAGVRVNLVAPGPIFFEGGWWDGVRQRAPALFERAAGVSALGRMGAPEDVARAVAFLASPAAGYITGASLRIDGGMIRTVNF